MFDFPFQAQLAIAVEHSLSKLGFQMAKAFDLYAHVRQLALKHGLYV